MADFLIVTTAENTARQVVSDHPDLIDVALCLARAGAVGALQGRPHLPSACVQGGRFRLTMGDAQQDMGPGDRFGVQSGLGHGGVRHEPDGRADRLAPRHDNFL